MPAVCYMSWQSSRLTPQRTSATVPGPQLRISIQPWDLTEWNTWEHHTTLLSQGWVCELSPGSPDWTITLDRETERPSEWASPKATDHWIHSALLTISWNVRTAHRPDTVI